MLLELKRGITYGPVRSRRLGASLGINLLPAEGKLCTFDCLYCQYGWTDYRLLRTTPAAAFPPVVEVLQRVEDALVSLPDPPAYLTFSGNGEPTLHPNFPSIVEALIPLRDRMAPKARMAILSNSATVTDYRIRTALAKLNVRIMKLDAGCEPAWRRFNRPAPTVRWADVLIGLRELGEVTIQCLFADGPDGNVGEPDVEAWLKTVAWVNPIAVQIYTLARDTPSRSITPASAQKLESIRERLLAQSIAAQVF
jgi:wyosine [tRNA(Phe)-imidazoG37] synthetase (radical SAM superfamily)